MAIENYTYNLPPDKQGYGIVTAKPVAPVVHKPAAKPAAVTHAPESNNTFLWVAGAALLFMFLKK